MTLYPPTQKRRLLFLAALSACCLTAAPNARSAEEGFPQASRTAIEKQQASVRRQMARISEVSSNRAPQPARSSWEKQRASIERQLRAVEARRSPIEQQRASVEKQLQAARPDGSLSTAFSEPLPVPVVSWGALADPHCQRIPPSEIHDYVDQVAKRESLAPELLRVVIARESSFHPCAVSHKGAMGMMQLMPATAADLGVANPFDPEENIDGGARYLSYLLQRFGGDLKLALAAYNAGPRRVDDHRGVPPIPETVSYVSSILRQLRLSAPQLLAAPHLPGRI